MEPPTVACTNCGKNMTTDDLRRVACMHCGQVLAHHARAAQQVAVVNQMLADRNGNGIPDAFEGLAANATANAYGQMGFGAPQVQVGVVHMGAPPQGPMMVHGPHGPVATYAHAHLQPLQQVQAATRQATRTVMIVAFVFGLVFVLMVAGGVAFALLAR